MLKEWRRGGIRRKDSEEYLFRRMIRACGVLEVKR